MLPEMPFGGSITGLLFAGAAIVLFLYTAQIWLIPILKNIFGLTNDRSAERASMLLNEYYDQRRKQEAELRSSIKTSPQLQMIKAAKQDDEVVCLLVNQGGLASNLRIEPIGARIATIEPRQALQKGQTGSVSLRDFERGENDLQFQLSYENQLGMRIFRKYVYSTELKNFIEASR